MQEQSIGDFWQSHSDRYQFLVQNFLIKQKLVNSNLKMDKVGLRIRRNPNSNYSYSDSLRDRFKACDKNRISERDIITSIYDFNGFKWETSDSKVQIISEGFIIQSCLYDNYNIRGHIWVESLGNLDNDEIYKFLDKCVVVKVD